MRFTRNSWSSCELFVRNTLGEKFRYMSRVPLPEPEDEDPENVGETHMRAKDNLDPKVIQQLELEILRQMQAGGTVVDPLFNAGLPDASVASAASTSITSSLYSSNASVSMESFTLDTIATVVGAHSVELLSGKSTKTSSNQGSGCCGSKAPLPKTTAENGNDDGERDKTSEVLPVLLPPPAPEDKNKICLVLDLDETLVHSSFLSIPHADFRFVLGFDENQVGVFVCIRPGAERFLKELGSLYEIVIFTASCQPYADQVIDYIDPGRVVKHRLYREACTDFGGNFVKDLSRLNRNLEKIIIVDNSPSAYLLQPYNAIAISSWFDEPMDNELLNLLDFLKQSYRVRNVYDLFSPN